MFNLLACSFFKCLRPLLGLLFARLGRRVPARASRISWRVERLILHPFSHCRFDKPGWADAWQDGHGNEPAFFTGRAPAYLYSQHAFDALDGGFKRFYHYLVGIFKVGRTIIKASVPSAHSRVWVLLSIGNLNDGLNTSTVTKTAAGFTSVIFSTNILPISEYRKKVSSTIACIE